MEFRPVLTKTSFVKRYQLNEFGNRSPTWNSWEEFWEDWQEDGWEDALYHIRNRVAGAQTWYNVLGSEVGDTWLEATKLFEPSQLYISAMCPTERTVIQGEVMRSTNSLELFYSTVKKPMREALKERSRAVSGIMANLILKAYLPPNDLDWLMGLLDRYPDHVVEFTTLDVEWGTVSNFRTLYWECRKY